MLLNLFLGILLRSISDMPEPSETEETEEDDEDKKEGEEDNNGCGQQGRHVKRCMAQ